jgi:hypothetical protein
LAEAQYDVVVWNRSPEKMHDLVGLGATPAASPADAARRSGTVITMVADPAALRAVTEGPECCSGRRRIGHGDRDVDRRPGGSQPARLGSQPRDGARGRRSVDVDRERRPGARAKVALR